MFVPHPDYPELNTHLRYLGYWRTRDRRYTRDTRPDPKTLVATDWALGEQELIAQYLSRGETLYQWLGSSTCRFCNLRPNGNRCLTDGTYGWPEGLAHTVLVHGVRPPREFVDHVLRGITPERLAP